MFQLLCFRHLPESRFFLALYTEEVNLQTFVRILCKTIFRNYLRTRSFILVVDFKNKIYSFTFSHRKNVCNFCRNLRGR